MPKTLASLLGVDDRALGRTIAKLEEISGFNSEDVRLIVDMKAACAAKLAELGLDPADTTPHELHHILRAKLENDGVHLARALKIKSSDSPSVYIDKVINLANHVSAEPQVLAIKNSVAKELLRKNPPKHLMKLLGVRSVDSLVKHADMAEVFAILPASESASWLRETAKNINKLTAASFELRPVRIANMSNAHWQNFASASRPVTISPLTGSVAAWPITPSEKQVVHLAALILQAVELIEDDSFYLKNHQFSVSFGKLAADLFVDGRQVPLKIAGQEIFGWGHLRKIYENPDSYLDKLAGAHPSLNWWKHVAHLALGEELASLNIVDNAHGGLTHAGYAKRQTGGFIHHLKSELLSRYASHAAVRDYILKQFDDTFIGMEPELSPAREFEELTI